jgi:hypothetical protein
VASRSLGSEVGVFEVLSRDRETGLVPVSYLVLDLLPPSPDGEREVSRKGDTRVEPLGLAAGGGGVEGGLEAPGLERAGSIPLEGERRLGRLETGLSVTRRWR